MENLKLQTIWQKLQHDVDYFRTYHVIGCDDIQYVFIMKQNGATTSFFYYLDDEGYIKPHHPKDRNEQVIKLNEIIKSGDLDDEMERANNELPKIAFTFMNNPMAEIHGAMTGIGILRKDYEDFARFKGLNAPLFNEMMESVGMDWRIN